MESESGAVPSSPHNWRNHPPVLPTHERSWPLSKSAPDHGGWGHQRVAFQVRSFGSCSRNEMRIGTHGRSGIGRRGRVPRTVQGWRSSTNLWLRRGRHVEQVALDTLRPCKADCGRSPAARGRHRRGSGLVPWRLSLAGVEGTAERGTRPGDVSPDRPFCVDTSGRPSDGSRTAADIDIRTGLAGARGADARLRPRPDGGVAGAVVGTAAGNGADQAEAVDEAERLLHDEPQATAQLQRRLRLMRIPLRSLTGLFRRTPTESRPASDTRSEAERASARDYWDKEVEDERTNRGTSDPHRR
jgi:hypothetical protein